MRYVDLLYSAMNNALHGVPPETSAAIDAIGIADTLFPVVSQAVSEAIAADPSRRALLRRQKTLTFVTGEAALSTDVLQNYIIDSVLIDAANLTKKYGWRDYPDFVRRGDKRLGIYSIRDDSTMVLIEPQANFTVPLTASGSRILTTPCVVQKPALATDQIDCPEQFLSDIDEALSESLRGQIAKLAGAAA